MKVKTCRICLIMDTKMVFLENPLKDYIEEIFKRNGFSMNLHPKNNVCLECKALLIKSYNFTNKALRAQRALYDITKKQTINIQALQAIDRNKLQLNSNLSYYRVDVDFFVNEHEKELRSTIGPETDDKKDITSFDTSEIKIEYEVDDTKVEKNVTVEEIIIEHSDNQTNVPSTDNEDKINKQHLFDTPEIKVDDIKDEISHSADNVTVEEIKVEIVLDNQINVSSTDDEEKIKKQHCKRKRTNKTIQVRQQGNTICESEIDDSNINKNPKKKKKIQSKEDKDYQLEKDSSDSNSNIRLRRRKRNLKYVETDIDGESEIDDSDIKEDKKSDDDYQPEIDSSEYEVSSSSEEFDDLGKKIKKPKQDIRQYPRKCDHCSCVIMKAALHFTHYLYCHTAEEYPYLREAKFVCHFCGIAKRTEKRLADHELTHGERTIQCDKCPSKFHNKVQLYRHTRRAHVVAKLICDYCNKAFKMKPDLCLHIRTHTGEKPFKCHICGAGFAHLGNVGIHIRSRHQNCGFVPKKAKSSALDPKKKKSSKKTKKVKTLKTKE